MRYSSSPTTHHKTILNRSPAFKILKKFRKIPLISTFYCLYLFITVFFCSSVFTIFKQQYSQLFRRLVFACCLKVYFLIKKQEKKDYGKVS